MSYFHGGILLPSVGGYPEVLPLPEAVCDKAPSFVSDPVTPFGVRTGKTLAEATPEELLAEIRSAQIIDADGMALADHIEKALERSRAGKLRQVVVSLLEPDPASLSLSSLGAEFADAIAGGLSILLRLLSVREGSILCEKNRPVTIWALERACEESRLIAIEPLENRYPLAHPKLLTRWLCQKELPAEVSPEAAGVCIVDAESCISLHSYFAKGETRCFVRTTFYEKGEGRVYDLPLGLPIQALIAAGMFETLSADEADPHQPLLQRGMMDARPAPAVADRGLALLVPADRTLRSVGDCVRCGQCVAVCPMYLQPHRYLPESSLIARLSGAPRDAICCIGCGCCSYVCPMELPVSVFAMEAREKAMAKRRERESAAGKENA